MTLAFGFVTFTPSSFAFATISTLFLDETAWEILLVVSDLCEVLDALSSKSRSMYVLCRERLVVHEQKVDIPRVVDDESLVAGRH